MPQRTRTIATVLVATIVASVLVWQRFHGGVPSHSFMARADMPSISNWWGLLTLPLLTWFAFGSAIRRVTDGAVTTRTVVRSALGAALFGAILAIAFTLGYADIPRWQVNVVPLLALAFPIYRAEYIWGFVLALSYTFGGVLPLLFAGVLALLGIVLHFVPRWAMRRMRENQRAATASRP